MRILPVFILAGLISFATSAQKAAGPKKADERITITSNGGAERDQVKNLMVYTDKVHFTHPRLGLTITCDRLELDPIPVGPKLGKAIATGNVVVRQMGPNGKTSIAKGQNALFDANTNSTTLSGKPQPVLEIGEFLFYADTITLMQNGQHRLGQKPRTVSKKRKVGGDGR